MRQDKRPGYGPDDYRLLKHMQVYDTPVSRIRAIGTALPDRIVDNDEIIRMIDAPAALKAMIKVYIERGMGVRERRYAAEGVYPSDLAAQACRQVLEAEGVKAASIDTLIFAATDMDVIEPATANILQDKLGIRVVNSFDVRNACNSVLQALNVANSMIANGAAERVLIACAEIGSFWANRAVGSAEEIRLKIGGLTLGDAGTALIVEPADAGSGILEINLFTKGEHWVTCHVPEDDQWRKRGRSGIGGWFYLDMPELARVAKPLSVDYFKEYLRYRKKAHMESRPEEKLVKLIPHQISRRFIEEIADVMGAGKDLPAITADLLGNTGSASIPVTLKLFMDGAGLSFGCGREVLLFGAASGFSIGHIRVRL